MEIWSHPPDTASGFPGKQLSTHLKQVSNKAVALTPNNPTKSDTPLPELSRLAGKAHDLGKATTYFQEYATTGQAPREELKNHAPLGALAAFHAATTAGYTTTDALTVFIAVAKHHGSLPDVASYTFATPENTASIIDAQINAIPAAGQDVFEEFFVEYETSFEEFENVYESQELSDSLRMAVSQMGMAESVATISPDLYPSVLAVWSALITADKTDAAGLPPESFDTPTLSAHHIDEYIERLQEGVTDPDVVALNRLRDQARDSAAERASSVIPSGLATLTLPTGYGKTLTGLYAALTALEQKPGDGRLIYALPFTSIIDQTTDVFDDVFDVTPQDPELTTHHSLAETTQPLPDTDSTSEYTSRERARKETLLGEMWRSGSILTTYVQLFESLAGPYNRQGLKLPALQGSVLVLDEPQALPREWWPLIEYLTDYLIDTYNCTVISMTATQPGLYTNRITPECELIDNPSQYFEAIDRVEYTLHDSVKQFANSNGAPPADAAVEYKQAAVELQEEVTRNGSVLAICNTIDSTTHLYQTLVETLNTGSIDIGAFYNERKDTHSIEQCVNELENEIAGASNVAVAMLTTRIRPVDRMPVLTIADRLSTTDTPVIVVATQLIEAGVDISFATVYRDLAPMDNVVQAAGRCNRSLEWETGNVTLWWLPAPPDTDFIPSQIYSLDGINLPHLTVEALESIGATTGPVSEQAVSQDAVDTYYELVLGAGAGNEQLVSYANQGQYSTLGDCSLLDTYETVDLVVIREDTEHQHVEDYRTAIHNHDYSQAKAIQTNLAGYQVSVPTGTIEQTNIIQFTESLDPTEPDSNHRVIDCRNNTTYYTLETGLQLHTNPASSF